MKRNKRRRVLLDEESRKYGKEKMIEGRIGRVEKEDEK